MTNVQLRAVMIHHLNNFNDEGVEVTEDTLHQEVLSDNDGFGAANSKSLYKGVIRWTLARNGHEDPDWPSKWMEMSVRDLAGALIPATA